MNVDEGNLPLMMTRMTRSESVSGKGKSKGWPFLSIPPPFLCCTSWEPGSIPLASPPILGEQTRQIGRVGSDLWDESLVLVGGGSQLESIQGKHCTFPPPLLFNSPPLHCSQSSPLSFGASYCKSVGQSRPRLIGNQGGWTPCQHTGDLGGLSVNPIWIQI